MLKTILKYTGWTIGGLLVIVTLAAIFITVPYFGNRTLIVRSGSMEPTIKTGDLVVVRPAEHYTKGDVITFRSPDNEELLVTHRIIDTSPGVQGVAYTTKGDANEEADASFVAQENIVGRQTFIVPYAGRAVAFAKTRTGLITLVVVPAAIVMLLEARVVISTLLKNRRNLLPTLARGVAALKPTADDEDTPVPVVKRPPMAKREKTQPPLKQTKPALTPSRAAERAVQSKKPIYNGDPGWQPDLPPIEPKAAPARISIDNIARRTSTVTD